MIFNLLCPIQRLKCKQKTKKKTPKNKATHLKTMTHQLCKASKQQMRNIAIC